MIVYGPVRWRSVFKQCGSFNLRFAWRPLRHNLRAEIVRGEFVYRHVRLPSTGFPPSLTVYYPRAFGDTFSLPPCEFSRCSCRPRHLRAWRSQPRTSRPISQSPRAAVPPVCAARPARSRRLPGRRARVRAIRTSARWAVTSKPAPRQLYARGTRILYRGEPNFSAGVLTTRNHWYFVRGSASGG